MKDKIKEIFGVIMCIALLIGLGIYTGFFNNYGLNDIEQIFTSTTNDIKFLNKKSSYNDENSSLYIKGKRTSKIGKYRANNIPDKVMKGFQVSGFWKNIFQSNRKVIFYVYDNNGQNFAYSGDFHKKFLQAFEQNNLSDYYDFQASEYEYFKNYYVGITGHTKICDSIDECKNMHDFSSLKSSMQMFLDRCAKYFCIIYPKKQEYILIRNRDTEDAINLLLEAKDW